MSEPVTDSLDSRFSNSGDKDEMLDGASVIRVFRRYKWGILSLCFVVTLITALWVNSLPNIYEATATLLIEPKAQQVVGIEDVYNPVASGTYNYDYYATQFEILRSRELAEWVIGVLGLESDPRIAANNNTTKGAWWRAYVPFLEKPDSAPEPAVLADSRRRELTNVLVANTAVTPVRGTQLVRVSFESKIPELSAEVANALANAYIESGLEARLSMTQKATSWLTERLGGLREKLEDSEQELQGYREQEGLLEAGGVSGFAQATLSDSAAKLISARSSRAEAESLVRQIDAASGDVDRLANIPRIVDDPLVQSTKQNYIAAQQELTGLRSRYGPKHPKILAAVRARDETVGAYNRQIAAAADSVQKAYEIAKANEEALRGLVTSGREGVQDINRKEQRLRVLEREVETNQQLYNLFLNRFKETSATGDIDSVNARFLDVAVAPQEAHKPRRARAVLIGCIVGLLAGVGLAFLRQHLDNTIKTAEELEQLSDVPVLGVLPLLNRKELAGGEVAEVFLKSPRTGFAEALRTVRTGVMLAGVDVGHQTIVVTSSLPGEGKTSVACGLAFALGGLEQVLLLDADMRKPRVGKLIGASADRGPGLAELIAGTHAQEECIQRLDGTNVNVLSSGAIPPNPLELLGSKRFAVLIEELASKYPRIVVDSPPCQIVSDPYVLAKYAQGVLFIVGADRTPRPVVMHNLKHLRQNGAHIIGAVLNLADLRKAASYYGSYRHYKHDQYGDYYGEHIGN